MDTKNKSTIIILLIIFLIPLLLISCTSNISSATTTTEINTIQTTTTTKALGFWDEENQATTITTVEETTTTISAEEAMDNFKKSIQDLIENGFEGKVTKIIVAEDLSKLTISYNTKWFVENTVKKEMFDIISSFKTMPVFDIELSATTNRGDIYNSFTSEENLQKISDLEMSYEDWLKVAFK